MNHPHKKGYCVGSFLVENFGVQHNGGPIGCLVGVVGKPVGTFEVIDKWKRKDFTIMVASIKQCLPPDYDIDVKQLFTFIEKFRTW